MAFGKFTFFSEQLQKTTEIAVVLPNDVPASARAGNPHFDRPVKTLYLLHGYTGSCMDWVLNAPLMALAGQYNLCFVMPSGDNSFYLDGPETGRAYARYTGQELVEYTRKTFGLSSLRADTYIGGFSMGGYGALHTGLACPDTFSKIMALSSALIQNEVAKMAPGTGNGTANYAYYRLMFGEPKALPESAANPEELVRRLSAEGKPIPGIYMACGTEDFLLAENRAFRDVLQQHQVPVAYFENPGHHDFTFWNQHLEPAIRWMLG